MLKVRQHFTAVSGSHSLPITGFAFFAVPVLLNIAVRGPVNGSAAVGVFAIVHVVSRLGHVLSYLANMASLRSLCFFVGVGNPVLCLWRVQLCDLVDNLQLCPFHTGGFCLMRDESDGGGQCKTNRVYIVFSPGERACKVLYYCR